MGDAATSAENGASVDAAAAELYAREPGEFTAARNTRADATTDRAAAKAIRALRKPTVAAWAVNLLAQGQRLGDALELAAELREAQEDLDAAELSRLGRQRRALVAALAADAVGLARARGVAVSQSARDEIENTLNAAMTDAAAAAAVGSGRLVRTLRASGLEEVDLEGAVAGSAPASAAQPRTRDDLAERRARKEAERVLREAERALADADRDVARTAAREAKARERAGHLQERIDDVQAQLDALRADASTAASDLDERTAEHQTARSLADDARAARDAARAGVPS
ncbi:transposase [Microbacterium sp. P01]|uniref:transposase n=1 Tax=Microbacterium sp. P01 TaxID=3366261 RepID=UPI00366AD1B9